MHGKPVELTRTEFDLLTALATRPGVVMRRNELLREVWETEHATDTHLVDVHVANVRRKLREHGEAAVDPHGARRGLPLRRPA